MLSLLIVSSSIFFLGETIELGHLSIGQSGSNQRCKRDSEADIPGGLNMMAHPYVVTVKSLDTSDSQFLCTGILINNTTVLTSTTCPMNCSSDMKIGMAAMGDLNNMTGYANAHCVTSTTAEGDGVLSALELDSPIEGADIPFAPLANIKDISGLIGTSCVSLGYGTASHKNHSEAMRSYNMTIVSPTSCEINTTYSNNSGVCAQMMNPSASCLEEIGAPLLCNGTVYGLNSRPPSRSNCSSESYVFTTLGSHKNASRISQRNASADPSTTDEKAAAAMMTDGQHIENTTQKDGKTLDVIMEARNAHVFNLVDTGEALDESSGPITNMTDDVKLKNFAVDINADSELDYQQRSINDDYNAGGLYQKSSEEKGCAKSASSVIPFSFLKSILFTIFLIGRKITNRF